jgi:hypothetical protein
MAGESQAAFQAYTLYRDLGPADRSLSEVTKRLQDANRETRLVFESGHKKATAKPGKHSGQISLWSRKFRWVERAQAWDDYVDKQRLKRQVSAIEKMAERHANQMQVAGQALMAPILAFARALQDPMRAVALETAPLNELMELSMVSSRLLPKVQESERLSRGVKIQKQKDDSPQSGGEWFIKIHQPEPTQVIDASLEVSGPQPPTEWEGDSSNSDND